MAFRFRSMLTYTYWNAVFMSACPSQSLTMKISLFASMRCKAVVWRKVCGVMLRPCSDGQRLAAEDRIHFFRSETGRGKMLGSFQVDSLNALVGLHGCRDMPGNEMKEGLDGRQALIASGRSIASFLFECVQKIENEFGGDGTQLDCFGLYFETLAEVVNQQFHAIAVTGDAVVRETEFGAQM